MEDRTIETTQSGRERKQTEKTRPKTSRAKITKDLTFVSSRVPERKDKESQAENVIDEVMAEILLKFGKKHKTRDSRN